MICQTIVMEKLLYEDLPPDAPLPVKEWTDAMQSAVDEVCDLVLKLVEVHKTASEHASEIAERLMGATSESELRRIVWESFQDLFVDEIAGNRDSEEYRDAVYDAWKYHCR